MSNVRPLPVAMTDALLQMHVESEVVTTILETEAKLGNLRNVDHYANEIRLDRWRKLGRMPRTPARPPAPFHIPADEPARK